MLSWHLTVLSNVCVDAHSSVLSRVSEVPIVSADLVGGDSEFQRIVSANENELSMSRLMSGGGTWLL